MGIDRKEIIHCSIATCNEVMIYDRQKEFWSCPRCGSEFWPNVRALTAIERERKSLERQEEERQRVRLHLCRARMYPDPLPAGRAKPGGGGSKSGGRKKRKKVAKKRPWELS